MEFPQLPNLQDIDIGESGKKAIIAGVVILGLFIAASFGMNIYKAATADKTPIVSIAAENKQAYSPSEKIKTEDFEIVAKHKDGGRSKVDPSAVTLSRNKVDPYGSSTDVTVTLKGGPSCIVSVKNKRSKVAVYKCGRVHPGDVTATLYNNGELHFDGSGEVSYYSDNNEPWKDSDSKTDIKAVTFGKNIRITDMSGYFSDIETLKYVAPIPTSVVSMDSAFDGCSALKKMPDISQCKYLKSMKDAFSDCTSLKTTSIIPPSVATTEDLFDGCTSLYKPAIFAPASQLNDATEMYNDCINLTEAGKVPSSLKTMDSMYAGCINLKAMPSIPRGVTSMDSTFAGCSTLSKMTSIPRGVKTLSNCFSDCQFLSGTIRIDANAKDDYGGMFSDAVVTTKVNLIGKSKYLNEFAYTSDKPEGHIFVRGRAAKDPDAD